MKYRPRIYYTEEQKALMWDRWERGETLGSIARLFERNHGAIAGILARSGGIRPAARKRSKLALTLSEREENFSRYCSGRVDPLDCPRTRAVALYRQPRDQP